MRDLPGRSCALTLLLLSAAACGSDNPRLQKSVVTGLRVLGVKAEPPEIRPLRSATLEALAVSTEGETLGYLWIACDPVFDPDPSEPPFSACEDEAALSGASGAQALFASGAARPLSFDLASPVATYLPPVDAQGAPIDLFASLGPGDPRRSSGASVTVILMVAPLEDLSALLADPEGVKLSRERTELVIKRLIVSESPTPNGAPTIEGVSVGTERFVDGDLIDSGAKPLAMLPLLSAPESFRYAYPDGTVGDEVEVPIVSWYATAGHFDGDRTQAGELNTWTPPFTGDRPPPPIDGRTPCWLVVRDGRGGTAWAHFTLRQ